MDETPDTPTGDLDAILDVLDDAGCRDILRATETPRTAKELADVCDLPLSTVYRKVDRLQATPLVEATYRIREGRGRQPHEYRRRASEVRLLLRGPGRPDFEVVPDSNSRR